VVLALLSAHVGLPKADCITDWKMQHINNYSLRMKRRTVANWPKRHGVVANLGNQSILKAVIPEKFCFKVTHICP
jgi:hypothetical protein